MVTSAERPRESTRVRTGGSSPGPIEHNRRYRAVTLSTYRFGMDTTGLDYLTLTVAIFGAVTGAVALGVQVVSFVMSGPRVKVAASANLHTGNSLWFLGIGAANVGRAPVTVQGIGVQLDGAKHIPIAAFLPAYAGPSLPHRLEPRAEASWLVQPEPLLETTQREGEAGVVRVYVNLATGKHVVSHTKQDLNVFVHSNAEESAG